MKRHKYSAYVTSIEEQCKDLNVDSVQKLGKGWMSMVLKINEEWAFRFAKNKRASADLDKEARILPVLSTFVSAAIPQFKYYGKQKDGLVFAGYRLLPGEILKEDSIFSFSPENRKVFIIGLSQFIKELRAFPVEQAKAHGVPQLDLHCFYFGLWKEVRKHVFPLMEDGLQKYISSRFHDYLHHPVYTEYTSLIHGDLSMDHILIDPETHRITGIIDFGDLAICDPDFEYRYILEDCGKLFLESLLNFMGDQNSEDRITKISYFVTFDHLQYILEGIRRKNSSWIQEGMEEIQREMNKNGWQIP
ncbi:aminoglycoside 2''-phosphotransferase [Fictibacillus solisalsi]|uniref:Aminoglycoside 2''-phosphotransferase n=1 Tax=Fictibacillus solisalsi TaxID=459525 RepID=A0A1G9VA69_9BACL|nr:phosphotransferase [Fictibacillus solisalsi]SDM69092.1 aminoglycoside 2''-phosphotransferase [Fictibacillus solisalsi]